MQGCAETSCAIRYAGSLTVEEVLVTSRIRRAMERPASLVPVDVLVGNGAILSLTSRQTPKK